MDPINTCSQLKILARLDAQSWGQWFKSETPDSIHQAAAEVLNLCRSPEEALSLWDAVVTDADADDSHISAQQVVQAWNALQKYADTDDECQQAMENLEPLVESCSYALEQRELLGIVQQGKSPFAWRDTLNEKIEKCMKIFDAGLSRKDEAIKETGAELIRSVLDEMPANGVVELADSPHIKNIANMYGELLAKKINLLLEENLKKVNDSETFPKTWKILCDIYRPRSIKVPQGTKPRGIAAILGAESIRKLDLSDRFIDYDIFAALETGENLNFLDLSNCEISVDNFPNLPHLEAVYLIGARTALFLESDSVINAIKVGAPDADIIIR